MAKSPQWGYGEMSKRNGVLFYLQLLLYRPSINGRSGLEEGCPHHSLPHFCPSHPLQIYVPLPIPILHINFSPHIRLKNHPSLCLLLYPSFYPQTIPLHLPLSRDLHPPLHLHIHLHLPLSHEVLPLLHLNLFPLSFPLIHYFPLHPPLPRDVHPPLHIHIYLHLIHLPIPLLHFIPLPLHSSHQHLPHYHLHPKHRRKIFQWLAALMPIFMSLYCEIVE